MNLFIGTYTKKDSQGIYSLILKDGVLSSPTLAYEIENPTYLQYDTENNFLYCNNTKNSLAGVSSFLCDDNNVLHKTSENLTNNKNACYISLDKKYNNIYSTIYADAIFEARGFSPDTGYISSVKTSFKATGKGIHPERQESSHLHISYIYNNYVFICDLGADELIILDRKTLTILKKLKLKAGCGPRHIIANKNYAYIVTELSNELIELKFTNDNSILSVCQYYPLLSKDFVGNSQAASIKLSKDNKYLYISNRGADNINVFKLDENGKIVTEIQKISTYGHWCRDFEITPDNKFLIAVHEKSYDVSLFKINDNGCLTFLNNDIKVPEAVCIIIK